MSRHPKSKKRAAYTRHTVLFASSMILAFISLIVNVYELLIVSNYLYVHYAWGDIPLAGLPWLTSLGLLVIAIFLGTIAERENK